MSAHHWHRPSLRAQLLQNNAPDWLKQHPRRPYVTQAVLATPPWVDVAALRKLALRRFRQSVTTGVPHVLDHVVPLSHPTVCGLNVPWNIQVIPKAENAAKSNVWYDEQGDWFSVPEQLKLSFFW